MATYEWAALNDGDVLAFNPAGDVLDFSDSPEIEAAQLSVEGEGGTTIVSFGDKTITLNVTLYALTTTNVTFFDEASFLIVGDNSTAFGDDAANTIDGSPGGGGDLLIGAGGNDTINGGAGDDALAGESGNDSLIGGLGDDTFDGHGGVDTLIGGADDDHFIVDVLHGGGLEDEIVENADEGTDTIELVGDGGPASFTLAENIENLLLFDAVGTPDETTWNWNATGNELANLIVGTGGVNVLDGADGDDTLQGHGGNDSLVGGDGSDYIDGGDGHDTIRGSEGHDTVLGGAGNDRFAAIVTEVNGLRTDARQSFEGGDGNDTITGPFENGVTVIAEYRNDPGSVIVNLSQETIVVDIGAGNVTVAGGTARDGYEDTDTLRDGFGPQALVDGVVGSGNDDWIHGGAFANSVGGTTQQIFEGLAGDDTIIGGFEFGGAWVSYESSEHGVLVNLSGEEHDFGGTLVDAHSAIDGWGDGDGTGDTDTLEQIDRAIGSMHDDLFFGGFDDEEHFEGLGGDDSINGGDHFDNAWYRHAEEGVLVDLGAGTAGALDGTDDGGTIGNDTLSSIEAVHGSDFNDSLLGGGAGAQPSANESLADLQQWEIDLFLGFEEFAGFAGDDTLNGGNDPAGAPMDIAVYRESPGAVFVNLGGSDIDIGGDTILAGTARDGYGVNGNPEGTDTLRDINGAEGSRFDDTLVGGAANEYFLGGRGSDSINGGGGADFVNYETSGRVYVNLLDDVVDEHDFGPGAPAHDELDGIENIIGTDGDDTLVGDDNDNLLAAMEGDDIVVQTRGHDTLDGGEDFFDVLAFENNGIDYTSGSRVHVDLGAGTSNADYDPANDAGEDVAQVSRFEQVRGTSGDDLLVGGGLGRMPIGMLQEAFWGTVGNDTIDGLGTGQGGIGFIDRVDYSESSGVTVDLQGGTASDGMGGTDTLSNINWITGSFFNDVFTGSDASWVEGFEGLGGSDIINGGAGFDIVDYLFSFGAVNVNLATGIASDGWGSTDALSGIEGAFGSGFNDRLTGGNNDEYFLGGAGDDTINGGAGIDFASYRTNPLDEGGVTFSLGDTTSVLVNDGMGGSDRLINIEGLEGTNADDGLFGGNGNHWFRGLGGSDELDGGANIDTVDYSEDPLGVIVNLGQDSIVGDIGAGNVTVDGGTAHDGWGGDFGLGGIDTLGNIENVLGSRSGDHITGSLESNLLDGNLGDDVLAGGGDDDTLLGGGGNDTLDGGAGDDTLDGGAGDDSLYGGDGADTFVDSAGNDELNGGGDRDTFFVDYSDGETVLARGDDEGGERARDTYVLSPDSGNYTFQVADFDVGTDSDRDVVDVRALLVASAVAGFYDGTDPLLGGFLRLVNETVEGGGLTGNTLAQWDRDGAAGGAHDFVTGLVLLDRTADQFLKAHFLGLQVGGEGNAKDKINGTGDDDILLGLGGNDSLKGAGGDDLLFGGTGTDTMNGGVGNDTYHVDSINDKITGETASVALVLPGGSGAGQAGPGDIGDSVIAAIDYTLDHVDRKAIENLQLFGAAKNGTGNALANRLTGNIGNDRLLGLGANDTLDGGVGKDTMEGGTGNDVFFVDHAGDVVKEALGATGGTKDTVRARVSEKLDLNVENLVLEGENDISGTGNILDNEITGNSGQNTLIGDKGNDTLNGGGGDDSLNGGAGNDVYLYDGMGDDTITEAAAGGTDTIRSSETFTLPDNVEHLVLTGNQAIDGTGNNLANRITGNGNDNMLLGGAGNGKDTLEGGSGNDSMDGGAGADSLIGGAGNDTLNGGGGVDRMFGGDGNDHYLVDVADDFVDEEADGGNHDTVHASITIGTLAANVETLLLEGDGSIDGGGNGSNNSIIGNDSDNILNGKGGDDFLDGGGGADQLIGGSGIDRLVWDELDTLIDGGTGFDVLEVAGADNYLLLIDFEQAITGLDAIDLTGNGDNTVALGASDVLEMLGNGDSEATQSFSVTGNDGDRIELLDKEQWSSSVQQAGEGIFVNEYLITVGEVQLKLIVDQAIEVTAYLA